VFKCLFLSGIAIIVKGAMEYYIGEFNEVDIKLVIIGVIFTLSGATYEYYPSLAKFREKPVK
jgi:hypothetical protein